MGQNFFPDTVNQTLLFPPSLHDWLPAGHLARFLVDVVSALDLSSIYKSYEEKDGRGQAAYAPEMMIRLLLYGYATGVYSSRKIQRRTYEEVAFRYLSGDQHPDHATIAEFRKRHLDALSGLFTQALLLCAEAGLVKLGHVAIDGTKIKANASKHKAMSYKRMNETEARRQIRYARQAPSRRFSNFSAAGWINALSEVTYEMATFWAAKLGLFGLIIGALAKLVMPGKDPGGIWITMLLGIAGLLLATWFLQSVGSLRGRADRRLDRLIRRCHRVAGNLQLLQAKNRIIEHSSGCSGSRPG